MTDAIAALYFPLAEATLCLDCNTVTDAMRNCPRCGSAALLSLANVLDRRTEDGSASEQEMLFGEAEKPQPRLDCYSGQPVAEEGTVSE